VGRRARRQLPVELSLLDWSSFWYARRVSFLFFEGVRERDEGGWMGGGGCLRGSSRVSEGNRDPAQYPADSRYWPHEVLPMSHTAARPPPSHDSPAQPQAEPTTDLPPRDSGPNSTPRHTDRPTPHCTTRLARTPNAAATHSPKTHNFPGACAWLLFAGVDMLSIAFYVCDPNIPFPRHGRPTAAWHEKPKRPVLTTLSTGKNE